MDSDNANYDNYDNYDDNDDDNDDDGDDNDDDDDNEIADVENGADGTAKNVHGTANRVFPSGNRRRRRHEAAAAAAALHSFDNNDYVPQGGGNYAAGGRRAMLEQRRRAALEQQRANVVQEQVVAGRAFHGVPFSASPSVVEFVDFEVGQEYRQKVVLTNTSFGTNSFQLLPSPHRALTFVYTPSGGLSAGMTTELVVVFKPRDNLDITVALQLLAQNGPFSLPCRCRARKCVPVVVPTDELLFGDVCRGDSRTHTLSLENKGALATTWTLTLETPPPGETAGSLSASSLSNSNDVNSGGFGGDPSSGSRSVASLPFAVAAGAATTGRLPAYSSITVPIVFAPTAVGNAAGDAVFSFDEPVCPSIRVRLEGRSCDLPVAFTAPAVHFRICQHGGKYTHEFVVRNTGKSMTSIKLEVPAAVADFLAVVPRVASIRPKVWNSKPSTFTRALTCASVRPSPTPRSTPPRTPPWSETPPAVRPTSPITFPPPTRGAASASAAA